MDTVNFSRDHSCYDALKKKVFGYFSNEIDGRTMSEVIELRVKAYIFILEGVEKIYSYSVNVSIRSFKHNNKTISSNKLIYNRHDDTQVKT